MKTFVLTRWVSSAGDPEYGFGDYAKYVDVDTVDAVSQRAAVTEFKRRHGLRHVGGLTGYEVIETTPSPCACGHPKDDHGNYPDYGSGVCRHPDCYCLEFAS